MATLAATFGGAKLAMGGEKKQSTTVPPINAKSSDEEKYIKYVSPPISSFSTIYTLLLQFGLSVWLENLD